MTQRAWTLATLLALATTVTHGAEPDWIGTWGTAAQAVMPGRLETFDNQTVRLVVHVSAGGQRVRVRLSNVYGDRPLLVRAARVARRTQGANIEPMSDRSLTFGASPTISIPAHAAAISDAVGVSGRSE